MARYVGRVLREKFDSEGLEEPKPIPKDVAKELLIKGVDKFFSDNPHVVYLAKTKNRRAAKDITYIQQELFYKCGLKATPTMIQNHLKEAMDRFDVKKYEEDRRK